MQRRLVEHDDDGYVYLDPYYPADGQPLRMTDDDLVAIGTASGWRFARRDGTPY